MFVSIFLIVQVVICGVFALPGEVRSSSRSLLETAQRIQDDGYYSEEHHVTTSDGYILEVHRIPFRRFTKEGDSDRPVVFMMHGLLGASANFIDLGPRTSIAYNLADSGFDVWMGNARGNRNSRAHVTLDPDGNQDRVEFFDFSWEEIGMIDVAAMIDYILEKTGNEKLHYIGHSQGGTAFLVLTSMRPEYNDKMASVNLLAGVGYMEYFPNFILRNLAQFTETIWNLARALGVVELFPPGASIIPFIQTNNASEDQGAHQYETKKYEAADYCTGDPDLKDLCVLTGVREILPQLQIIDAIDNMINENVGGASLKQIAHYGQNIQDKIFRRWNYGPEGNQEVYGTVDPPVYDLSLITTNVTMHYTLADSLLDERDVLAMAKDMPNTVARKIARETFGHVDFIAAPDVRELVTSYIIESIRNAVNQNRPEPETGSPNSSAVLHFSLFFKVYLIILSLYYLL